MKNKNTIWSKFKGAITDFSSYQIAYEQTLGAAIKYLFLICLVFGGVSSIVVAIKWNDMINNIKKELLPNIPSVVVQGGEAYIDEPMPLVLGEADSFFYVYIDTNQIFHPESFAPYRDAVFVDGDYVYVKSGGELQTFALRDMNDFSFSGEDINILINKVSLFINIVILILGPLLYFMGKFISTLVVMGLVGLISSKIAGLKLRYEDCCKLGAYALTLPIVIKLVLGILTISIPKFWVFYYGIAIFYLIKAGKAIEKAQQPISTELEDNQQNIDINE